MAPNTIGFQALRNVGTPMHLGHPALLELLNTYTLSHHISLKLAFRSHISADKYVAKQRTVGYVEEQHTEM